MRFQTIADIFESNDRVRRKLRDLVEGLSEERGSEPQSDGGWSIAQVVEHLSLAEQGMTRICGKLLKKAAEAGELFDGNVRFSENFLKRIETLAEAKLEAPEPVRPVGGIPINTSLAVMVTTEAKRQELRPMFEKYDGNGRTFPHPYFGELTAVEWLALIGGHEYHHIKQIRRLLNIETKKGPAG